MEISKKVTFHNFSQIYQYHNNDPTPIKTKLNDGPSIYKSFFEQFILSYLLNKDTLQNLFNKYHKIINSTKFMIINDISHIINNLKYKKKHHFYIMNYMIQYSEFIMNKIYTLYKLLNHLNYNLNS